MKEIKRIYKSPPSSGPRLQIDKSLPLPLAWNGCSSVKRQGRKETWEMREQTPKGEPCGLRECLVADEHLERLVAATGLYRQDIVASLEVRDVDAVALCWSGEGAHGASVHVDEAHGGGHFGRGEGKVHVELVGHGVGIEGRSTPRCALGERTFA